MARRTDSFDLGCLRLSSGEGRRLELEVRLDGLLLSGERYDAAPGAVPAIVDVARMTGGGYSLRLRFSAGLRGPCMRCLLEAAPRFEIDAREIEQPGGGDELDSPYVSHGVLDLHGWARDALALALPAQVVCRGDCAGLCPTCGANLNDDRDHRHEAEPDRRWAKLDELKLD